MLRQKSLEEYLSERMDLIRIILKDLNLKQGCRLNSVGLGSHGVFFERW